MNLEVISDEKGQLAVKPWAGKAYFVRYGQYRLAVATVAARSRAFADAAAM